MAENWYILKVRAGFEKAVVRKLQQRGFRAVIPDENPHSGDHVYCRFAAEDRQSITAVPGVLDIIQQVASPLRGDTT